MVANERQPADQQVLVRVKNNDLYLTTMDKIGLAQPEPVGLAIAFKLSLRTGDGEVHEVEEIWGERDDDGKLSRIGEVWLEYPAGVLNPVILKPVSGPKPSEEGA